jgi:hypothetical protein
MKAKLRELKLDDTGAEQLGVEEETQVGQFWEERGKAVPAHAADIAEAGGIEAFGSPRNKLGKYSLVQRTPGLR